MPAWVRNPQWTLPTLLESREFEKIPAPSGNFKKFPLGAGISSQEFPCPWELVGKKNFTGIFIVKLEGGFYLEGFLIKMECDVELWSNSFLKRFLLQIEFDFSFLVIFF